MLNGIVTDLVRRARGANLTLAELVAEVRKQFIESALTDYRGNQVKAAAEMKIHRNTLRRQAAGLNINMVAIRQVMSIKKPVASVSLPELIANITKK